MLVRAAAALPCVPVWVPLSVSVIVVLAVLQTVGIVAVHEHVAMAPVHQHHFQVHGDGHVGHADDLSEGEAQHHAPADGSQRAGLGLGLLVVMLTVVLAQRSRPGARISRTSPARRIRLCARQRLALLSVLRV